MDFYEAGCWSVIIHLRLNYIIITNFFTRKLYINLKTTLSCALYLKKYIYIYSVFCPFMWSHIKCHQFKHNWFNIYLSHWRYHASINKLVTMIWFNLDVNDSTSRKSKGFATSILGFWWKVSMMISSVLVERKDEITKHIRRIWRRKTIQTRWLLH